MLAQSVVETNTTLHLEIVSLFEIPLDEEIL